MFTDVFHPDADAEEGYHNLPAWSVSQLKLLPDHPEEFYGLHVADPPLWIKEPTPAMQFGTKVHARLLEPDTFSTKFPQSEPCFAPLKSGKNAGQACGNSGQYRTPAGGWLCGVHAKGMADLEAVDCLSSDDALRLNSIVREVNSDGVLAAILDIPGQVEYALFGTHEATGLPVRGRLDKWYEHPGGRAIIDVKTISCDPANERLVAAQFLSLGYHRQAAFYLDLMAGAGLPCGGFGFIAVKTSIPFNAVLWFLNDNDIDLGRRQNELAFQDLKERLAADDWTNERHGKENYLTFPGYAYEGLTFVDSTGQIPDFTDYA